MKFIKNKLIIALGILAILVVAGYTYEYICEKRDLKNYMPVGKIYDVNNKKMHIYSEGSGDVTVILGAGWGTTNPYADFYPLYDGISKIAKFAVYDRFGYGYSDITPDERDIDSIVNEIHELLEKSGQKPPYIYVAHSLASLEAIRFAQLYKDEVKGIILIDGGNPESYASVEPITFISSIQYQMVKSGMARLLYKTDGFQKSINSERNELKLLPNNIKELDKVSTLLKSNNKNIVEELKMSKSNAIKVINSGKLNNIYLTIITSGDFGEADKSWISSQEKLKEWSNLSKQFVVQDTRHYIHQYQPSVIIKEIEEMINK